MADNATVWADLVKSEKQDDGTLMVYGKVSDESIDLDLQIADDTWLKAALPEWFATGGNIREMHQPVAAGVATEYEDLGDGHWISAKIVDPGSITKVEHGVLKGFSIGIKGPRVIRDKAAAGGRIVGGKVIEVSLADRPSCPTALLTLAKAATTGVEVVAADFDAERALVRVEEFIEKAPALHNDPVITEPAQPSPVAGDEVCECCDECPGDSCDGTCCAACQYSKQPTASGSHTAGHAGSTATNGPSSSIKAPEADLAKMPTGMTSNDVRQALETAIRESGFGRAADWCWVCDFTDTNVVYNVGDSYFEQGYTISDDGATLTGVPTEVVQHTNWQPKAATIPEDEVTPARIADALKAGQITEDDLRALLEPAPDGTKSPDADPAPVVEEPSDSTTADAVKAAVAEAVAPLLARLETVEKTAAPGGPSRTRTRPDEVLAHRGDELRSQAAGYRATAKTIDNPELAKAYIDLAVEAETALNKLAG